MNILSILGIAIGLSMDAVAVSMAKGMCTKKSILKAGLKLGFWFGIFQAFMPFLGWSIGVFFQDIILAIDHWIAFVLLSYIGYKLIEDSIQEDHEHQNEDLSIKTLFILAIATSIDALTVGVSFAFLDVDILLSITIIGITTFILSILATYVGKKVGSYVQKYTGIIGGIILILIGLKILIQHLYF
ncbi:MAG: manganese efflux pump MntP family protein [Erysipelotrichaceae bacterium]|nr:manganese efflux pump MntP family protein [Erysipelotrichaceae bacterium]